MSRHAATRAFSPSAFAAEPRRLRDTVGDEQSRRKLEGEVFRSERWSSGGVNIGRGTAPETFTFARNAWFCRDWPERSKPALPAAEVEGLYGRDPLLDGSHRLGANSPARGRGADPVPPIAPR